MSYRRYDIPFYYGEPAKEAVEKDPTTKKVSKLGVKMIPRHEIFA